MRMIKIRFPKRWARVCCLGWIAVFLFTSCATQDAGREKDIAELDASQLTRITSIALSEKADTIDVVIDGSDPLTYTSVKQPQPLGVVLYFPTTRLDTTDTDVVTGIEPVTAIHASQVNTTTDTTRVEILLSADIVYNVIQDSTSLVIRFERPVTTSNNSGMATDETPSDAPVQASAEAPAPEPGNPSQAMKTSQTFQGTGARIGKEDRVWVNRMDFLGEADGRSTLSIETTEPVDYDLNKVSEKVLELRLKNANIAEFRQRPMITTRFESAVNRIMPIQLPSMKDNSLFTIELREPVGYYVEQTDGLLQVHFEASSIPPAPADEANLPEWKKALEETFGTVAMAPKPMQTQPLSETDAEYTGSLAQLEGMSSDHVENSPEIFETEQAMVLNKPTKKYTGEKISLDFYQTDIKNVFRILREVSGMNFAIDKDVSGKVTLTLDKPVPWDQVLDLVLKMNQLGMTAEGDIVRIATQATLKSESDLRKAQIAARQKEKEQIIALEPLSTRYIPISYSDASQEVVPHIEPIITKGRGSVSVDSKNNQIIITDTVEKIIQAEEIAQQIDKVTSQVIIEARVVEVKETYTKELGFSWDLGVGPVSVNNGGASWSSAVAMNYPAASNNGFGLSYTKISGTPFTLDAALTALEINGNGKILSAPKILTLNNKKAKIKQGQEIGYLERDSAGGSSVKFKDVDLLLEVTPHVTPDNRISLYILIQKNDVTGYVDGVPVISTNEAETQLLVNDGDTIVIGGIIKASTSKEKNGFPGLHTMPLVGWMFGRRLENVDNNELLIFMNPKIVQLEQRIAAY
jgi:type IV pilus assembly protein PilQ